MQELYKETFSHLHASGDRVQEAKTMKKGHIRKGLAIAVAAAALMATAAGAANAATDGRLFEEARIFFLGEWSYGEDGSKTVTGVDENGSEIHFSVVPGTNGESANGSVSFSTTTEGEGGVLVTDSGATVYQDEELTTYPDGSTSTKSGAVTITPAGGAE